MLNQLATEAPSARCVALCVVCSHAVALADCAPPAHLQDGWQVATPAEKGLDAALLCGIGPRFQGWKEMNAHAVVVARYGALVYEHYYAGEDQMWGRPIGPVQYDAEKRHDLRSVTKSITSLVFMVALDQKYRRTELLVFP